MQCEAYEHHTTQSNLDLLLLSQYFMISKSETSISFYILLYSNFYQLLVMIWYVIRFEAEEYESGGEGQQLHPPF